MHVTSCPAEYFLLLESLSHRVEWLIEVVFFFFSSPVDDHGVEWICIEVDATL